MANARPKQKSGRFGHGFPSRRDEGVLDAGGSRCESVRWDFDQDEGATGTYTFKRILPEGAIVTRVYTDELTTITDAGATGTVQLKAGTTDLTAALDATGGVSLSEQPLDGAADAIKITADSELQMEIAGEALTAGELRWFVQYLVPNDQ